MRDQHSTATTPRGRKVLKWLSFAAATLLTATAEHDLAVMLGSDDLLAWAFPVMLDCYAAAAFMSRSRGNVAAAILLMIVCQGIAHVAGDHVSTILPVWVIVIVSAVPPVILWRIHDLDHKAATAGPDPAAEIERARAEHAAAIERLRAEHAAAMERLAAEHATALSAARNAARAERRATTPSERPAHTRRATAAGEYTREQVLARVVELRAEHPGITQEAIAATFNRTDRWLRKMLATPAAATAAA